MTYEEVSTKVRSILIQHFSIQAKRFSWDESLEMQQEQFKILSYLVFLEQLFEQQFGKKIPLLENISAEIHSPKDVVELIIKEL